MDGRIGSAGSHVPGNEELLRLDLGCGPNTYSADLDVSRPSLTVFLLSSLRLSYFFLVAMVVGCIIAVTP